MLTTTEIDSVFFRRLTNRLKPKLVHPTAKAFDLKEWMETTRDDVIGPRDEILARTAGLIGFQMKCQRRSKSRPLGGAKPGHLTRNVLLMCEMPIDWAEQERQFGFAA